MLAQCSESRNLSTGSHNFRAPYLYYLSKLGSGLAKERQDGIKGKGKN